MKNRTQWKYGRQKRTGEDRRLPTVETSSQNCLIHGWYLYLSSCVHFLLSYFPIFFTESQVCISLFLGARVCPRNRNSKKYIGERPSVRRAKLTKSHWNSHDKDVWRMDSWSLAIRQSLSRVRIPRFCNLRSVALARSRAPTRGRKERTGLARVTERISFLSRP